MGIQIEFNPDLCLRAFGTPERGFEECLPEKLEVGRVYKFQKQGQRNYWLEGNIPLKETKGNQQLSRPLASIRILEATHKRLGDKKIYTTGTYLVNRIFNTTNPTIHFEGYEEIRK